MSKPHDEYVRNLLREEYGYVPLIRRTSPSGNDVYGKLYDIRTKTIADLQDKIYNINEQLMYTTDPDRITVLGKMLIAAEKRMAMISPFGYDSIRYDGRYPLLEENHDNLAVRFHDKYYDFRIGYNTLEAFSAKLRNKFEDIAPFYENKLRQIKMYESQIKDDMSLDDISSSEGFNTNSVFNDQDPERKHKTSQYDSGSINKTSSLSAKIDNITAADKILFDALRAYLNEYRTLFINVWGDETEGFI